MSLRWAILWQWQVMDGAVRFFELDIWVCLVLGDPAEGWFSVGFPSKRKGYAQKRDTHICL